MTDGVAAEFELPQLYRHHIFACLTQRPPGHPRGSCGASGAQPLWERMAKAIEAERMTDIGFTAAGCLGFCSAGPVESHFKQGKRVDRLVMVLARN